MSILLVDAHLSTSTFICAALLVDDKITLCAEQEIVLQAGGAEIFKGSLLGDQQRTYASGVVVEVAGDYLQTSHVVTVFIPTSLIQRPLTAKLMDMVKSLLGQGGPKFISSSVPGEESFLSHFYTGLHHTAYITPAGSLIANALNF